jgi:hypothetical protein
VEKSPGATVVSGMRGRWVRCLRTSSDAKTLKSARLSWGS